MSNDRLLSEVDDAAGTSDDTCTIYGYGLTGAMSMQTIKTVYAGLDNTGTVLSDTQYAYDDQGRMIQSVSRGTSTYAYDDSGNRISQNVSDQGDTTLTSYLVDDNNPTGYSQVLEKHVDGDLDKPCTYTLGLDVIAQNDGTSGTLTFDYDGHGSTRALLSGNAAVMERFAYDAYGEMINSPILGGPTTSLTTLLYSGEQSDVTTGLQYLRARYYDPSIGRFTSADGQGFASNDDPVSLHRYLYVEANPVNRVDLSGYSSLSDQAFALADEYTSDEIGGLGQVTQYLSGAAGSVFAAESFDMGLLSAAFGGFDGTTPIESAFDTLGAWLGASPSTVFGAYLKGAWEGASDGFKAWVNGATPFFTPFSRSSFYSPDDPTLKFSYAGGVISFNAWVAAAIPNLTAWAESPAFYEIGQTTLPRQLFEALKDLSPIERGQALVRQLGWVKAATLGFGNAGQFAYTWKTGLTPTGWLVIQTFINVGNALSKLRGN